VIESFRSTHSSGSSLIIFAKSPRLGTVKTRLQSEHPARFVRQLYIALLRDTLTMARHVPGVRRRVIAFTPRDGEALLRRTLGAQAKGFEFVPQYGHDLGERMANAFEQSFREGATRTVIIGTDSPSLPTRLVEEAFAALRRNDLVLGPSTDGGYYLIGVRSQKSGVSMQLLSGVEWSTERVLQQTITNARRAKLKIYLLDPWYDVDTEASLRFLQAHLSAMMASGSKELPDYTRRVLRKM
jgi:uncharacterized protein